MNPHKIIRIDWVDSASTHGWRNLDSGSTSHVCSIGYLVRETSKSLVITSSLDDAGNMLDPLAIPTECIVRKTFLRGSTTKRRKRKVKRMSFKKVAAGMARKQGISVQRASAELAAATRRASPAAKRANPKLRRVKG